LKHKLTPANAGMWKSKFIGLDDRISTIQEVDIDRAGNVPLMLRGAAHCDFDLSEVLEQLEWIAVVAELDDGVEKRRGAGLASHRFGFIDGRGNEWLQNARNSSNSTASRIQVAEAIAKIRSKRNASSHRLL
jgi:hypothetical protein